MRNGAPVAVVASLPSGETAAASKFRREQRFKRRQRDARAEAAQKMAAGETGLALRREIPGCDEYS